MTKIVMVVNNPATMDYRVVKSAEMLVAVGHECHVVGVLKPNYPSYEELNGVTYHRVKVQVGFRSLLLGYFPKCILLLEKHFLSDSQIRKSARMLIPMIIGYPIRWLTGLLSISFKIVVSLLLVWVSILAIVFFFAIYLLLIPYLFIRSCIISIQILYKLLSFIASGGFTLQKAFLTTKQTFLVVIKKAIKDLGKINKYANAVVAVIRKFLSSINRVSWVINLKQQLGKRLNHLQPAQSPFAARYLMGRYLSSWYKVLIDLEADVYHAHELWSLESCALAASTVGAKLVYDSHELEPYRNNDWCDASNKARVRYESKYIGRADSVITVSEGCASELKKIYKLKQVLLLRNTPRLSTLQKSKKNLRDEIGVDIKTPLLIYTGSVTFNRGLELVFSALKELQQFHLATVGSWDDQVKGRLIRLAEEAGLSERVHFHPKVPPQELIDFISPADIAIIPIQNVCLSYYHCLPNKLFEAAFAGLPVVASDLPDMSKFIVENNLGETFENDNLDSLVKVIRSVYSNIEEIRKNTNVEYIRNENCFEKESQSLLDLYRYLGESRKPMLSTLN